MDINDLRSLSTVLVLVAFLGICWWAFSPRRKKRFDDAAQLPFADEMDSEEQHIQTSTTDTSTNGISENKERD